jgi:hypothetical protein
VDRLTRYQDELDVLLHANRERLNGSGGLHEWRVSPGGGGGGMI